MSILKYKLLKMINYIKIKRLGKKIGNDIYKKYSENIKKLIKKEIDKGRAIIKSRMTYSTNITDLSSFNKIKDKKGYDMILQITDDSDLFNLISRVFSESEFNKFNTPEYFKYFDYIREVNSMLSHKLKMIFVKYPDDLDDMYSVLIVHC